jgi:hypothetical protein
MNTIDLENFSCKYIAKQPTEYVPSQGSLQNSFQEATGHPNYPLQDHIVGLGGTQSALSQWNAVTLQFAEPLRRPLCSQHRDVFPKLSMSFNHINSLGEI